jgi:hypothetical protein
MSIWVWFSVSPSLGRMRFWVQVESYFESSNLGCSQILGQMSSDENPNNLSHKPDPS